MSFIDNLDRGQNTAIDKMGELAEINGVSVTIRSPQPPNVNAERKGLGGKSDHVTGALAHLRESDWNNLGGKDGMILTYKTRFTSDGRDLKARITGTIPGQGNQITLVLASMNQGATARLG